MEFTLDTTLGEILDEPQAAAILDQYLPGASDSPIVAMAKGMSLKMLLALPQAKQLGLTEAKAEKLLDDLNKQVNKKR
jgi:alpha-L-rhamnosidase